VDPNIFNDSLPVLAENATYYWRVDMVVGSVTITGSVLDFETGVSEIIAIPSSARNPYPAMGASEVRVKDGSTLLWQAGDTDDSVMSYNLFASESSDLSNPVLDVQGLTSPEYPCLPDCLEETVTYFWRVDEVTSTQTITGSVWNFTTHIPLCLNPPAADVTGDCAVTLPDFAVMAAMWLEVTDLEDLIIMAAEWLDCGMALAEDCP